MSRPVPMRDAARIGRALAMVVTLAMLPGAGAHADVVALTDATVHTVSGPTLEHATVVIRDGRIAAVGADATVPEGATVVPCAGKQIYPGMIAANTTIGLIEVSSVLGTNDTRETGSINPNVRAEVEVNPESERIPVTRVNGVTSALVVPQGGVIAGTSALMHLDGWTYEDMTVKAPFALHIQWPAMSIVHAWFITQSDEEQKKEREKNLQLIRNAFDDARAYLKAEEAEGRTGVPRHDRDVKWDAMVKALKGEIPVVIECTALNQMRAALRFCDEQGLKKIVFMGGEDADKIADELKTRGISVICDGALQLPRRSWEPYDQEMSLAARLWHAGVPFCISDGGGDGMNTRNLPYEAAMAAAYGLPRDEALKAVTLYPAQILGVADKLGSIETGKIADLMVTNGDPLETETQVEQVYINGKAISMETRQTRLFHKYDQRPRGPKARKH
ncbi:MAG: amidohydrolase family protein [Candidatus Eisenbacteria bacterium]